MSLEGEPGHRLRVLHVSDLHARGPREREGWRRRRVLGEAWEQNLEVLREDGPVDLVFFTGDAADRGDPTEYAEVSDFLAHLLGRLNLPPERLFVVPGNHDIARPVAAPAWRALRAAAASADPLRLSRWLAGGEPPPGCSREWLPQVLSRLSAYRDWVHTGLGRLILDPAVSPHGNLGYRVTLEIDRLPFPVHVLGLDTAWLCGDDADAGRLWLTEDQLMRLATDENGSALSGLRLALLHHPLHELADGAECLRLLAGHVDLLLRGHLHSTELEEWRDPDRSVPQVAAGCLYEGDRADHHPNACQMVTLALDPRGRPTAAHVRFRAWSRRSGAWHDDDSLYRGSARGRLTWTFSRPAPSGREINPFDPWTPVAAAQWVGRRSVLGWLAMALEQARSLSLVGDRRIGKTSLLRAWAERAAGGGRQVALLDGQGPEGVSPGAFVTAATGLAAPDDPDDAADVLNRWAAAVGAEGQPPLLLVDESDGLLARFDARFFERLRGMLGRICLVFASRRELDRIYDSLGRTSPFDNRLQLHWLGLLEPEAAEELARRGASRLGAAELGALRRWAGRHPFFLQLLGWHLVEARAGGEPLDLALDRFRAEAAARLRDLWRGMTPRDREALRQVLGGVPAQRRSLRLRGLVTEEGLPFGEVVTDWLQEEDP